MTADHTVALLARSADHGLRLVQAEAVCSMMEMRPDRATELIPRLRSAVNPAPPLGHHRAPTPCRQTPGTVPARMMTFEDTGLDTHPAPPSWRGVNALMVSTLQAIADHRTDPAAAASLGVSVDAMQQRARALMAHFGAASRVELVVMAFRAGVIQ